MKSRKLQRKSQTRRKRLAAGVDGGRRSLRGMTREEWRAQKKAARERRADMS